MVKSPDSMMACDSSQALAKISVIGKRKGKEKKKKIRLPVSFRPKAVYHSSQLCAALLPLFLRLSPSAAAAGSHTPLFPQRQKPPPTQVFSCSGSSSSDGKTRRRRQNPPPTQVFSCSGQQQRRQNPPPPAKSTADAGVQLFGLQQQRRQNPPPPAKSTADAGVQLFGLQQQRRQNPPPPAKSTADAGVQLFGLQQQRRQNPPPPQVIPAVRAPAAASLHSPSPAHQKREIKGLAAQLRRGKTEIWIYLQKMAVSRSSARCQ